MKISREAIVFGKIIEFRSIEDATLDAAIPGPWSDEGRLESLASENKKLREIVARLIDTLAGQGNLNSANIKHILGYGYEVSDE